MLRSSAVDPAQVCVRINGFGTPYFEKDLEAVGALGISRVMVPMAEADRVAALPQVRGLASGSAALELSLRTRRRVSSALSELGPRRVSAAQPLTMG